VALLQVSPYINLQKEESLDPGNPYRTMFVAVNDGYLPIGNIKVTCNANAGGDKFKLTDSELATSIPGTIWHSQKFTLPCINFIESSLHSQDHPPAFVLPHGSKFSRAEMNIVVQYSTLWFVTHHQSFFFSAESANDGSLHWSYSTK
jgi:hypothetical protein